MLQPKRSSLNLAPELQRQYETNHFASDLPSRVFQSSVERNKFETLISLHFLSFFCLSSHHIHTGIIVGLLIRNTLKGWMGVEVLDHPQVQRLHISDRVHDAPGAKSVGIFRVQSGRHNSRLVLSRLEVRIGEANKDFAELPLLEEVGQKFH